MKIFQCENCGRPVYFDNVSCEACGATLGFLPEECTFKAVPDREGVSFVQPGLPVRFCGNHVHNACNWLLDADGPDHYCASCRLNQIIPPLESAENLEAWRSIEGGKRRLIYSLMRLGLPLKSKADDAATGLAFDFLSADGLTPGEGPVLTGHSNGLITLNIAEADPAHREHARRSMGEPYRTIIGHFRHEVGHYYWERLVYPEPHRLEGFRERFGDERRDYAEALQNHYNRGPAENWPDHYLSAYASAHPWEDWAETWAHYLHLLDLLETAHAFGIRLDPCLPSMGDLSLQTTFDPYETADVDAILSAALPLSLAVNSLNRGMGLPDIYPFVLSSPVVEKLRFIHEICRNGGEDRGYVARH